MSHNDRPMPHGIFNRRLMYLAISLSVLSSAAALAAPDDGVITGGSGSITTSGNNTTIVQDSDRLSIDWESFNISADERVEFIQPAQTSVALNRILSNDASQIFGQIDANGHVILMNPNGIIFGEGAEVNVGGLVASGLAINTSDFMNGDYIFKAGGDGLVGNRGLVINRGLINAAAGGNIALLGQQVANEGLIRAELGMVALAGAQQAVLTFDPDGMLGVQVTEKTLRDLGVEPAVSNSGEIKVNAGSVLLTSQVSQDIFSEAVNTDLPKGNMGVDVHEDGSFTLVGAPDVVNTGVIDVHSYSAVEVRGSDIVHSGSILIDSVEDGGMSTSVALAASGTVLLDGGRIVDPMIGGARSNAVTVTGKNIGLTDGTKITIGPSSRINIGHLEDTDHVFIDDDVIISAVASNTMGADTEHRGNGGDITVSSKASTVVKAFLNVRGMPWVSHEDAYNGGTILLESAGLLGFTGATGTQLGGEYGEGGKVILRAERLTIANDESNFRISPTVLNAWGPVRIEAVHSIKAQGDQPMVTEFGNDFTAVVLGSDEEGSGIIDLTGLTLDAVEDRLERSEIIITMEADSIIAPRVVGDSDHYETPRGISLDLTTRSGDIIHHSDVNTWGGFYRARATGDVRFESGASLLAEQHYEFYPERYMGAPVEIDAGGDIALTVGDLRPGATGELPLLRLNGKNVNLSLPYGSFAPEDALLAEITAENLMVSSAGDFTADAYVSGTTDLLAPAGGVWLLTGDYNVLSIDGANGLRMSIDDLNNLVVGNLTLSDDSQVILQANGEEGTLSQAVGSQIELQSARIILGAEHIKLGADGTASVSLGGVDGSVLEGTFRQSLSFNGLIQYGSEADLVSFVGTGMGDNIVTTGEHAQFIDAGIDPGTLYLNEGHTINLAADLPLAINLGDGADVVNLLAPDLTYNLHNLDENIDIVNPYVEPPLPPVDNKPKHKGKHKHNHKNKHGHNNKHHGALSWLLPRWCWQPLFAGFISHHRDHKAAQENHRHERQSGPSLKLAHK